MLPTLYPLPYILDITLDKVYKLGRNRTFAFKYRLGLTAIRSSIRDNEDILALYTSGEERR